MTESDKKRTPFVVLFQGRCGSTYLVEALAKHSRIRCWKEYFSTLKDRKYSAAEQLDWLDSFYNNPPAECTAVGFKTKLDDVLDLQGFAEALGRYRARVIHLQRRNTIKLTVSFFNAMRLNELTGDWNLYEPGDRPERLNIDLERFDTWLQAAERRSEAETAFVTQLGLPTLNVSYEDLLADETRTLHRIMDFLDVDHEDVRGDALKVTSNDMRDAIENFDELWGRYKGTSY
jgi:LPS sulfotransferase NodH